MDNLSIEERRALFGRELKATCYMTPSDAGLAFDDIDRMLEGTSCTDDVLDVVLGFAADFNLDMSGQGWNP